MFEIQSASLANSRQSNASNKAKTSRPAYTQKTEDTFQVYSTSYAQVGINYEVRFLRSDDKLFAHCECEAGLNNQPCYHVMRVYDTFYSKRLMGIGTQLLNRSATVGNLGFIGTKKQSNAQTVTLSAGQVFEARIPVKLTIEPQ